MKNTKINLAPGFRLQWEEAQRAYVLLFPEGLVNLNESSVEILQLCNGQYTQDEIIDMLQQRYPDAELSEDVHEFLKAARDKGWLHDE